MQFYDFMKRYLKDDTPRGDLARDMKLDMESDKEGFPRVAGKEQILDYLFSKHACKECLDAFKDAWKDYIRLEKRREERERAEEMSGNYIEVEFTINSKTKLELDEDEYSSDDVNLSRVQELLEKKLNKELRQLKRKTYWCEPKIDAYYDCDD